MCRISTAQQKSFSPTKVYEYFKSLVISAPSGKKFFWYSRYYFKDFFSLHWIDFSLHFSILTLLRRRSRFLPSRPVSQFIKWTTGSSTPADESCIQFWSPKSPQNPKPKTSRQRLTNLVLEIKSVLNQHADFENAQSPVIRGKKSALKEQILVIFVCRLRH